MRKLGSDMALQTCPDCGKPVSSEAWVCPTCGKPLRQPTLLNARTVKWGVGIWLTLVVAFIVVWQLLNQAPPR